jgi:hypothetical protein
MENVKEDFRGMKAIEEGTDCPDLTWLLSNGLEKCPLFLK